MDKANRKRRKYITTLGTNLRGWTSTKEVVTENVTQMLLDVIETAINVTLRDIGSCGEDNKMLIKSIH